jgi:UDP-N-acetylglucosamine acyltransferase
MGHFYPVIHPTAIIHPRAKVDPTVSVGPYAVIDEGVELGAHCVVGPHVYLTGLTTIGEHNIFYASCVIGGAPQDLKYKNEPTRLRLGDHNVCRENFTVHRSNKPETETVIGSHNYFMVSVHIGHNSVIGDGVIIVPGAQLAGHVTVEDRALISGNCLIHQFCRVGTLALMQGGSAISQDLPPFTIAHRVNEICGLNVIGLRRAGFTAEQRLELKRLYRALFRSGKNLRAAVEAARTGFTSLAAKKMLDFVAGTQRGVCSDVGGAAGAGEDD